MNCNLIIPWQLNGHLMSISGHELQLMAMGHRGGLLGRELASPAASLGG